MISSNGIHAEETLVTKEYLANILKEAREKFNVPAAAVTIMNSDSIPVKEIQGVRITGTDNHVTFNDYFHIGSCSKSVMAVMAGKLIESGKISWSSEFFDVYPELVNSANNAYLDITLEDLFLCEAGRLQISQRSYTGELI